MAALARMRTTVLLNLAAIVERADEQVLPAVYLFIGHSLRATPAQLGTLTLCRAMVQALSSPISGILGNNFDRTSIVSFGCFLWGVMTAAVGMCTSLSQAMLYSAANGVGLALVIPCVQSLIADYNPPESRGRAFGVMFFTSALGGMAGGFFATNLGGMQILGLEGWRCAFHLVAALSIVTSVLVMWLAVDPRRKIAGMISPMNLGDGSKLRLTDDGEVPAANFPSLKLPGQADTPAKSRIRLNIGGLGEAPGRRRAGEVLAEVLSVMRIRTFQIIVLQGIVGSTPWNAMVFFTLWLQLTGFSNFAAAALMAVFAGGCALGGLLGGYLGDYCARIWPERGRIMAAQFSVACGLPLSVLLLKGLPVRGGGNAADGLVPLYGTVMLIFGLLISWCGSANSVMFAEIVPEQLRSVVYAFDRSFEGAIAACAAPLVGMIAERVFGFEGHLEESVKDPLKAAVNAQALANALLCCLLVPWTFCLIFYTGLYRHFPRDRRRVGAPPLGADAKISGQSPRPSPASVIIVGAGSGASSGSGSRERLAPRSGHLSD
ncbi:MFS general substrate transporter [Coccomyxa subellipsoidea C-169]|uniref:MFS general substrate transporter n=1 Tax=Coccomyxa subellipsoidea (strain C-169) TaxID=574566 RepID=I0YNK7_COCSC|nr:MFS general substrate transporter [Coccomyxa subellipsoidea C-169]EIE19976.1 MFS general substrate transporter [Coccomyxa subellipsoidea C-169]|eukprot:XP_005644520.1 MFS general substrate transporter [Coccomyxa subellipsoidea C-169]